MKKVLLLDLDYTVMFRDENRNVILRPFLKEFIERHKDKYEFGIYTAGSAENAIDFLRQAIKENVIDYAGEIYEDFRFNMLYRDIAPEKDLKIEAGTFITIKCLETAATILDRPVEDLIILDDKTDAENPHNDKFVRAPAFYNQENDEFLKDLNL